MRAAQVYLFVVALALSGCSSGYDCRTKAFQDRLITILRDNFYEVLLNVAVAFWRAKDKARDGLPEQHRHTSGDNLARQGVSGIPDRKLTLGKIVSRLFSKLARPGKP